MTQNLGNLVSSVIDAQRRVRDSTRQTPEWRSAQRAAVKARLEYWDAMGLAWDARHATRAPVGKPWSRPTSRPLRPMPGSARRFPAPCLAQTATDGFPAPADSLAWGGEGA